MADGPQEMVVFSIEKEGRRLRYAAGPGYEGALPEDVDEPDVLVRVGSASPDPDGGYRVQLTCLPLDGVLIIRPSEG
ncbi:hypothetical protein Ssi03_08610 [Sphaerisporangium siamense]|uniref:Uncharacterized protein n=1 Tax=Sphaerisporangium siamense TaxID=795645 RepID=A0A7W7GEU3_9ACTN|nr:hypothetical protein [Sphaerisporangium siamense]MBB4705744.1 hypothetical protein [Sphaerisporangium siamense]GII82871.1 hypothetical protein Ssi03_08610 [Sphaerisporangium siamense]